MGLLGMTSRPATIQDKQAVASVGQARLMEIYRKAFRKHGVQIGQILLTRDDLSHRRRHLNARNTIEKLLALNVVPVINENDSVVVDELMFGDNDRLAAKVGLLANADLVILVTDVDGLLNPKGEVVREVSEITDEIKSWAGSAGSKVGLGGMVSKLYAMQRIIEAGVSGLIISGHRRQFLSRLFHGVDAGTCFKATRPRVSSRRRWIGYHLRKKGKLIVDEGCRRALVESGRSLLPSGIVGVEGRFERGAAVEILDEKGQLLGHGITEYQSEDIEKIKGRQTREISGVLGYSFGSEVIHRNDMTIVVDPK